MADLKITDVREHPGDSAFLIDDSETSVLYDSGFGFTGFAVAKRIKKALAERKLDYIFLTHSHYDHALGSAYILKYWPDATVVAGEYAAGIFKREGAKAVMKELDRKFADQCGVGEYEFLGDDLRVDIPVSDGDIVKAGNMNFEVINLPGHTRCSVGFYLKEHRLLLSSETLGVYDGDKLISPSFLVGYGATLESIEKIKKYKIDKILSPHLGILDREHTRFFLENAEKEAKEAAQFISDRLKNGLSEQEIIEAFKAKYRRGYIEKIYPEDAVNLNTSIMIKLIKQEILKEL